MPRTSKTEVPVTVNERGVAGRYVDLAGFTVSYETFDADIDPAPLFRGLPEDRCQCPHWGLVIKGKVVLRFSDHEEAFQAGDAYYTPPGHVPLIFGGTELIEFSPTAAFAATLTAVRGNLEEREKGSEDRES